MNYVISICAPENLKELSAIYRELDLALTLSFHGRGTAVQSMLDVLGIDSNERRIAVSICSAEKTKQLIKEQKRRLFIGVPGRPVFYYSVICPFPNTSADKIRIRIHKFHIFARITRSVAHRMRIFAKEIRLLKRLVF